MYWIARWFTGVTVAVDRRCTLRTETSLQPGNQPSPRATNLQHVAARAAYDGSRGHGGCGMRCTACCSWRGTVLARRACRTVRARRRDAEQTQRCAADPDRAVDPACTARSCALARMHHSRSARSVRWSRRYGSVRGGWVGAVCSRALTVARCDASHVSESLRFTASDDSKPQQADVGGGSSCGSSATP